MVFCIPSYLHLPEGGDFISKTFRSTKTYVWFSISVTCVRWYMGMITDTMYGMSNIRLLDNFSQCNTQKNAQWTWLPNCIQQELIILMASWCLIVTMYFVSKLTTSYGKSSVFQFWQNSATLHYSYIWTSKTVWILCTVAAPST